VPVPRLFEAPVETTEQWAHTLACLIAVAGPETRAALVSELVGRDLPGIEKATVRERRAVGGVEADVVLRDAEKRWSLALWSTLGFGEEVSETIEALAAGLGEAGDAIVVVVTPDRRPPQAVDDARAAGREVHHKSWLRVRDWVQERPERGNAQGIDLMLLTEAEYFLTPRVAELYRLEGLMPHVPPSLRSTLATVFFDLNDISPAPLIERTDRVAFPRTGDWKVEMVLADGELTIRLAGAADGPGFSTNGDGWSALRVSDPEKYVAARSFVRATARGLLPARL
jgi:hypothetical protein